MTMRETVVHNVERACSFVADLHGTVYGLFLLLAGVVLCIVGTEHFSQNVQGVVFLRAGVVTAGVGAAVVQRAQDEHGVPALQVAWVVSTVVSGAFYVALRRVAGGWVAVESRVWEAAPEVAVVFKEKAETAWWLLLLAGLHTLLVTALCWSGTRRRQHPPDNARTTPAFLLATLLPFALYLLFGALRDANVVPFHTRAASAAERADALFQVSGVFFVSSAAVVVLMLSDLVRVKEG